MVFNLNKRIVAKTIGVSNIVLKIAMVKCFSNIVFEYIANLMLFTNIYVGDDVKPKGAATLFLDM